MPQFTLTRTGEIPVTITGELIGSVASSNAAIPDKEHRATQWFAIDLYRTATGTIVSHVKYRAGAKLGRENPIDRVTTDLASLDTAMFVSGWPCGGKPDANRGRDYTANHASVVRHGQEQLTDAITKAGAILGTPVSVEIV